MVSMDAYSKALIEISANRERERIIKLLEESDSVCNEWAIALIKEVSVVSQED